jgi:3-oxoacyl-[acyl-carrier protein] reductase
VQRLFAKAEATFGSVNLLVNNAGIAHFGLLTDISAAEWRRIFATNVDGAFFCTQAALPNMIHQKSGCIINISSIWGLVGASCEVAYSAGKGALIAMTKALAKEVGPSGIRVNCVAPGVIDTAMNSALSTADMDALLDETPLGMLGHPEDIAETVAFLASDKAKFITGQIISPNGGFTIY